MYNISAKTVQSNYFSWNWRLMQNFEEKLTYGFENDMRNLGNFYQNTRKSQNCDFDGIILSKIKHGWVLKRRITLLKRNRLVFPKLTFDELWSEHSKVSKTCSLMGSIWTKYIMFELKKYKGVMFDDIEDW